MRAFYILPALLFLLLAGVMGWKITHGTNLANPQNQAMLHRPLPDFSLPSLADNSPQTAALFKGKVSLLHFFASWCVSCVSEREEWEQLSHYSDYQRVAVAWNDPPEKTRAWLEKYGNPFTSVLSDQAGKLGVQLGITGIPETMLIAPDGTVAWRWSAPLTQEVITNQLLPLAERLNHAR